MLERFWGSELRWNGTNSVKANGRACCWLGRYGNGRQTGMWWWWSLKLVKRSEGYNSKEDDTGILLFGLGMKIPEWAECSQMRPICDSNTGCGQMWLGVDSRNWMEQENRKVYGRVFAYSLPVEQNVLSSFSLLNQFSLLTKITYFILPSWDPHVHYSTTIELGGLSSLFQP